MKRGPHMRKSGGCHRKSNVHRKSRPSVHRKSRSKGSGMAAGSVPEPAVADDDGPPLPGFHDNAQPAPASSSPLPSPPSSPPPHQAAVDISSPEAAQALDQMKVWYRFTCVTDTIVHMYNTG